METGKLEFKVNDEWEKFSKENSWAVFIPEFAKDEQGNRFMRRKGSSFVYRVIPEGDDYKCICANCDSEIMSATIAHSIWDGLFPCSGSGQCEYEYVPYCPKCEQIPDFRGSPIQFH